MPVVDTVTDVQKRNTLDIVTVKKVGKSMLLAAIPVAVIKGLELLQTIKFSDPDITYAVMWIVPVLINAIRQFRKGVEFV